VRAKSIEHGAIRERYKALSVEHGAIRGQHRAGSDEQGAIPARRRRPSVEHEVIRERCGALSVEHGAIRGQRRAGSDEQGAIPARRGRPSVEHGAIRDRGRARREANGAIRARNRAASAEHGAIRAQHKDGKRRARSNPGTEWKVKCRERSNPRPGHSAQVLSTERSAINTGIRCQPRSNPCIAQGASVEHGVIHERCKVLRVGVCPFSLQPCKSIQYQNGTQVLDSSEALTRHLAKIFIASPVQSA
jgi:hypothetical protein